MTELRKVSFVVYGEARPQGSKRSVAIYRGGKPVTPNFITGQFRPQTTVRRISRTVCFRERTGMGCLNNGLT